MTHIEIILSFIIFVTAVGFALYFFSPTRTSRLVDTSLEYVERELAENASVILKTYSIIVNNTGYQIPSNVIAIEIDNLCGNLDNVIIAENISGSKLNSKIKGSNSNKCPNVNENKIIVQNEWKEKDFIFIKVSEGIMQAESSLGNAEVNNTYYQISTSDVKKLLSEKKLDDLNISYYQDYLSLKKEFNIPGRVNFGFKITLSDKIISAERFIPSGLEVYSKIKRIEILRRNGEIEYADLTLKVW